MKGFYLQVAQFIHKTKLIHIILGILLIFAIIYTAMGILAARKKISELNERYRAEVPMPGNDLPRIFEIRKENAFTEARLSLTKNDSVSLIIDLKDSTVSLDLKGVAIHKAQMVNYTSTAVLSALSPEAQLNLINTPMKVLRQSSTIVKEPEIIKKAPKDTIEAAQQEEAAKQDSVDVNPSFYYFALDNGIEVTFVHEHEKGHSYFPLFFDQKMKIFKSTTDSLKHFKLPSYTPEIRIELFETDAKTIYRALPNHALVAIRM
ncbi:hypothetical protein LX69_02743 [Breznakibacter xylanolyticus]|uniref:Uncharacterized protein n=1 Tax=Breznakibacter xylanolyticus TaxID=990 RepID=A0A2W7PTZ5_9BACT|nr:hypothetical protein [Breznakibacter xylanolyticus]MBN2744794.1 hypothetical protein [Marinilabiliaceae bacterium]PZX12939.1 hypothetical protein LX69_02743 [Breznakibacter xylanolyticus]